MPIYGRQNKNRETNTRKEIGMDNRKKDRNYKEGVNDSFINSLGLLSLIFRLIHFV